MKSRFLFATIFLSVLAGLLAQVIFASDNEKDSKMEGGQICRMIAVDSIEDGCVIVYVIDNNGVQLEKGMDVYMIGIGNGKKYTIEPDEDGDFEFKNLSSGEYTVSVKIKNGDYCTSRRIKLRKIGKATQIQINKRLK